ncbi:MAG: M48 family metallopeptidase [Candidatus Zixiibacteriota bacterium]|nr:MAG: M48 family metallopeptidase [candidate division Zixibacteria bacterium]
MRSRTNTTLGLMAGLFLAATVSGSSEGTIADSIFATDSLSDSVAVAAGQSSSDPDLYPLTPERYEKLASYSRLTNIWRFVEFFVGIATLAIILFSGLSARFRNWASKLKYKFFVVWGVLALVLIADYLLNLPLSIYRSYIVELNYEFMNQTFMQWWGEDLLALFLGVLIGIIPAWFFYWLVNQSRKWWFWFSMGAIPFLIFFIVIAPVIIMPLFNEYVPLEDKQLESKLLSLADRVGIDQPDVFQVDASKQTTKVNAMVTGLLGSKRIVLYDNLIAKFTHDEILYVMGHEMGHYVLNHMWQGLGAAVLFLMLTLWITSRTIHVIINRFKSRFRFDRLGDYASLPLVLIFVSVIMFVGQPITNGFSRWMEVKADAYGMDITDVSGEVAATAFDKLSAYNLSDPDPHPVAEFWFYDHPALKKRMAFVRNYER